MSRMSPAEAERVLAETLRAAGLDPSDDTEEMRTLYRDAMGVLYPKSGERPTKELRARAVRVRAALETLYPYFRQDAEVRKLERRQAEAAGIDVVLTDARGPKGFVSLRPVRGTQRGPNIPFVALHPLPSGHPDGDALVTVLSGLWHYAGLVDASTPVTQLQRLEIEGQPGAPILRPIGGSTPLGTFLENLR